MRYSFGIALLATVALAKKGRKEDDGDYVNYAVKNGKHLKNINQFMACKKNFEKNHEKVKGMNNRAKGQNVQFADNWTSDLTDEEFSHYLGLNVTQADEGERRLDDVVDVEGRNLQTSADNIDWVAAGKMRAVRNQGQCGSCWAWAAAAAQEGVQAIKNDDGQPCARLSEQQAVDCSDGSCARGGWMSDAWGYWKANGAMSEADYPYTARDRADGECLIDSAAITVSTTDSYGRLNNPTDVSSAVAELKNGPMAVAVNSGNKCWRFYKGGLLTEEKAAEEGCGTGVDHAVTLVAFTAATEGDGSDEGDDSEEEQSAEEPICVEKETCKTIKKKCKRAWKVEKAAQQCGADRGTNFFKTNRKGVDKLRKCCKAAYQDCETITECTPARNLQSTDSPAYWTIQNSWGSGWGGNGGFMNIEVTSGLGVTGINQYMYWVTVM